MSHDDPGRINGWRCRDCGHVTYGIHVDRGVTPMFMVCRVERPASDAMHGRPVECGGTAVSLMYPDDPPPPHVLDSVTIEFYVPDDSELADLDDGSREHVEKGGALRRALTDAGRAKLDEQRAR